MQGAVWATAPIVEAQASPLLSKAIAAAPELRIWEFDPYTNELQITVPEGITPEYSILTEPPRISIDIPNGDTTLEPSTENYQGIVRQVRIAQIESGVTRIVMEFAPGVTLEPTQVTLTPIGQSNRWIVRPAVQLADTLPTAVNEPEADLRTLPMLPPSAANQPPGISMPLPLLESSESNSTPEFSEMPTLNVPPPPPQLSELNITVDDARSLGLTEDVDFELPVETPTAINSTPTVTVPPVENIGAEEGIEQATTPIEIIPILVNPEPEILASREPQIQETQAALDPGADGSIAFGQTLPVTGAIASPPETITAVTPPSTPEEVAANIPSDVLLSSGTVLVLSYPGSVAIALEDRLPRQEVLLVYSDIYDGTGQLIAPVGTPVIGSFVRDRGQIRFQTQSIVLKGRAIPFLAQSEPIDGNRDISERRTLSYSALGAVAGAVLGGLAGGPLLGGAAAGAVTSVLRSDIAATVEPGQILPVRLSEHWR